MSLPTTEPLEIQAGDRLQWRREDLDDYSAAAGWVLSYVLVNAAKKIEITAAADGTFFEIDVAAATSTDYPAGLYSWQAYATNGTDRRTVDRGTIRILPDFSAVAVDGGLDARSEARKGLEAIEAAIAGTASSTMKSYQIEGKSVENYSVTELLRLRDDFKRQVAAEDAEAARETGKQTSIIRLNYR